MALLFVESNPCHLHDIGCDLPRSRRLMLNVGNATLHQQYIVGSTRSARYGQTRCSAKGEVPPKTVIVFYYAPRRRSTYVA